MGHTENFGRILRCFHDPLFQHLDIGRKPTLANDIEKRAQIAEPLLNGPYRYKSAQALP
ncbi:hypothetical protein D3C73_1562960 [compost metagenome]